MIGTRHRRPLADTVRATNAHEAFQFVTQKLARELGCNRARDRPHDGVAINVRTSGPLVIEDPRRNVCSYVDERRSDSATMSGN